MAARDFILNNFRWKLGALSTAMFVWFIIQLALSRGCKPSDHPLSDVRTRTFFNRPVHVLTPPMHGKAFKLTPSKVEITIRSSSPVLNKLSDNEVKAFVNLADKSETRSVLKAVSVYVPPGVELDSVRIEPEAVAVEEISRPE